MKTATARTRTWIETAVLLVLAACGEEPIDPVDWRPIVPETLPASVRAQLFADLPPERLATNEVLVVDGKTGDPVAGADVLYLPGPVEHLTVDLLGEHELWYAKRLQHDRVAFLTRYGRHAATDESGRVQISSNVVELVARKGNLFGELDVSYWEWCNRPEDPRTLALKPEVLLRVQLVDADGRPLPGAAVRSGLGRHRYADNSEAIATLRNPRRNRDGKVELLPLVAGFQGPPLEVDLDTAADPVQLVFPRTGRLVLEIRDRTGQHRLNTGWQVGLGQATAVVDDQTEQPDYWRGRRLRDGRYAFPFVSLDQRFQVDAQLYDLFPMASAPHLAGTSVLGPTSSGDTKKVILRERSNATVLTGRAVDPNGRELGKYGIELRFRTGGTENWGLDQQTTADGIFRFVAPTALLEETWSDLCLEACTPVVCRNLGYFAVPKTQTIVHGAVTDLGEVRFEKAPLLVSGRVVDANGRPARAELRLVRTVAGQGDVRVVPNERLQYLPGMRFSCYFDEPGDGQWEVRVFTYDEGTKLSAVVPFAPGTEDLLIRLD